MAAVRERENASGYEDYDEGLIIERDDEGVLLVTMNRPHALNAMTYAMHSDLVRLWHDVKKDRLTKVIVVTGAGRGFSSGADLKEARAKPKSHSELIELMDEGAQMVWGMVNLDKPIVSAINGPAVGSGAALALLADVSVAAEDAKIFDGHTTVGVVSGDHSVLIWPLLCGMARAKYYLLLNEPLTGTEAARIGLVTEAAPVEQVLQRALEIAHALARGSQEAIRGTKRTLNHWLRQAGPAFEHSLALEMLGYYSGDIAEARTAFEEKRPPRWPSAETA